MNRISVVGVVALLALGAAPSVAQETATTTVTVRVLARDAKLVGSGVGGAEVTIVNAATGEVLARGKQEGGTGNTKMIMATPHARGMTVYDTEGAAAFVARLQIDEPTVVTISAMGPLGYPQAMQAASTRMLLLPGADIEGDGVVLELHGFIVEIEQPQPMAPVEGTIDVVARVRMMCGCPIEPGGLWDANQKSFVALLVSGGKVVARTPLEYAGRTSMFRGRLAVPAGAGDLELAVVASDREAGNFGMHRLPLANK